MLFIIIQARMTSSRLPGKVMLPLCGKPVLQVMLERLERFKDNIIIATTDDGTEQPIVALCQQLQIKFFQGDTDNVLQRYYRAAQKYHASDDDVIVRLTSDCPLIDPLITSATIDYYLEHHLDYASAGMTSGFPRGMDTEVFSFALLSEAYHHAVHAYEREHVTPYMHTNCADKLSFGQFKNSHEHSQYRLTLDEQADYQAITQLYNKLGCRTDFHYDEMIAILQDNPYIYQLNAFVEQKKINA